MTNTAAVRSALLRVNAIKAPTKRAAFIAETITSLSSQSEVQQFTAQIRRWAGVQDPSLLPESRWLLKVREGIVGYTRTVHETFAHDALLTYLNEASSVAIDWPSVTFHWGVRVEFTAASGERFVAYSSDYQLTETYLSS